ncbi:MAG: peptidase domain-containing ABC transporter [Lysobacter sp.]|nr:peptidase domain-containing ABC transporter [Lysobacter sp.]
MSADAIAPGRINFTPWRALSRLPLVLQTEIAECGLACLAMISGYHGRRTDLADLRARLGMTPDGLTLKQLMTQAARLGLSAQTVRAELASLRHLRTPCVLHWGLNHFVVLKKAGRRKIVVHDPQLGVVKLTYAEASAKFTGFAVEFQPNQQFETRDERKTPTLRSIIGRTQGLGSALTHILCLALLLEVVSLISPAVMQWLIDNGLASGDRNLILTVVAGMGLLMIVSLTVGAIRSWMVMYLSVNVGFQWSSRILTHLLHLPVDFFERRHLGDVMSRFGSVSSIQQTVTTGVIEGILDGLVGIATLVMIWMYSPLLAMTAIGALVALVLLQLATFETMKRIGNEALVADARVSSNFLESIRGIRPLKLAGLVDQRRMSWQNLTIEAINVKVRQQWMGIAIDTTGSLISGGQRLLAIFLAATMIAEGKFTIGMLFAYLSYQDQFMSGTGGLVQLYFRFKMLRLHFERLSDIVLTPPEQLNYLEPTGDGAQPESSLPVLHPPGGGDPPSVEFDGVSFRYSEFGRYILSDLSFSSAGSRCTVITGRTGIGKTTIFKLILGVYRSESGQILINGKPIGTIPVDELRSEISCVFQDDALFAGSIRENIAFFDPELDQARVEECAVIACLHEDIGQMTMGYHTPIGDMGSTLSAGQKQRILIARALYRKPRILLLDESTSDLDVNTELQINRNLSELDLHRIYIAHRPQTIQFGDRVVEL